MISSETPKASFCHGQSRAKQSFHEDWQRNNDARRTESRRRLLLKPKSGSDQVIAARNQRAPDFAPVSTNGLCRAGGNKRGRESRRCVRKAPLLVLPVLNSEPAAAHASPTFILDARRRRIRFLQLCFCWPRRHHCISNCQFLPSKLKSFGWTLSSLETEREGMRTAENKIAIQRMTPRFTQLSPAYTETHGLVKRFPFVSLMVMVRSYLRHKIGKLNRRFM